MDESGSVAAPIPAPRLSATIANSPLKPIHETNQQYTNNSTDHISIDDNPQVTKLDTTLNARDLELPQPEPDIVSGNSIVLKSTEKTAQNDSEQTNSAITADSSSSSGQQLETIESSTDPTSVDAPREKIRYEETIIDGFAICAFKSWEELQDDVNERIALNKANKANTASEKSSSDKIIKRKRKEKPKNGQLTSIKCPSDTSGSFSQTKVSKAAKRDKKESVDKIHKKRKSSSDKSAESTTKIIHKKPRESNSGASRNQQASDRSLPRDKTSSTKNAHQLDTNGVETFKQISASRTAINNHHGPHTSQSPQVHQHQDNDARKSRTHDGILKQESLRDPSAQSQAACSATGINPHPQRSMYDITSNANHAIKMSPRDQTHDQSDTGLGINQNSHQQPAESRQARPQHAIPSSSTHHTQPPMPYRPSTMYTPPHLHQLPSQSMNHHVPYYGNPMQPRPPHPHFATPIGPHAQTTSSQPATSSSSSAPYQYPTQNTYNYAGAYHPPNNPPYYPHDNRQINPTHPFGMYRPYQQPNYPQHSSSVLSSTRMSSLPGSYGRPYIVTDTTISKQTSIVPSPVTAAFQQAASSMANRFGHPGAMHAMNPYNAPPAAQSQTQPSPLYASPQIPPDKSFFQLAQSYCGPGGGGGGGGGGPTGANSAAPSSFLSFANPAYQPSPPVDYASGMYAVNRWPGATLDPQAAARFGSFYPPSTAALIDRTSTFGGYGARPAPFPAGMFPPAPF